MHRRRKGWGGKGEGGNGDCYGMDMCFVGRCYCCDVPFSVEG